MAFGRRRQSSNRIGIRDLADYRMPRGDRPVDEEAFDGRSVDVQAASRGLGVSTRTVRNVIANARTALSDKVLGRISGRAEADTTTAASARGMLQAAFGRGPRGGPVNAKAAAQALGVSQGTVRRWASGTQKPSADRLKSLRSAARRSTTTKRGRKVAVDEFRNSSAGKDALQRGTTFWVFGYQGVPAPLGDDYSRDNRMMQRNLTPVEVEDMLRRFEDEGIDGFRDWLHAQGTAYRMGEGEWEFTDIYDLGFGDRLQ